MFDIREDDLSHPAVLDLLAFHLARMHENSPPGHVFALDDSGLRAPNITIWSVWCGDHVAGIGALKDLTDGTGEIKSMRTHPKYLRKGVATLLLKHIINTAQKRGLSRLSLETGSGSAFDPALALYRKQGFKNGDTFADYLQSGFNQFLHLTLR